jgi:hypothetical protein
MFAQSFLGASSRTEYPAGPLTGVTCDVSCGHDQFDHGSTVRRSQQHLWSPAVRQGPLVQDVRRPVGVPVLRDERWTARGDDPGRSPRRPRASGRDARSGMERTLCQGVELSTWGALGVASLYRIAGAACVVSRFCGMPHAACRTMVGVASETEKHLGR